jgi:pyruvate dehydrogenase E2 component (dihydrolipoamide acetyltransferase)
VSAIAAHVDFGKMQTLMQQFAGAELTLSVDALVIRAASGALVQIDVKVGINWEAGIGAERRLIGITDAANLSMGALQSRLDAVGTDAADPGNPAFLSIRRIGQAGIRAVSMPLLPGHAMRLVVSMVSIDVAECLLCFDAGRLSDDDAAAFLARLRDDLEMPLRLLA